MKMQNILRRALLLSAVWAVAPLHALAAEPATPADRPNIILIVTDQQSAHMLSCTGNKWLETPAMDYIAANGIRFERAYTTNPVCSPARIGLMTGRFPGYFTSADGKQPRENGGAMRVTELSPEVQRTHIAAYLKRADYELAYSGKSHLPKPLSPQQLGFNVLSGDPRGAGAKACADFIQQEHARPYYLWVNFMNPHDICYFAINNYRFDAQPQQKTTATGGVANKLLLDAMRLPEGVGEQAFFARYCPPLPSNYEPQADEPAAVTQLIDERSFRRRARQTYTDRDWRLHRWAYHRLTERVDAEIQIVLDAVRRAGQEENTVVILTSDHGDMDASHKMEHKSALYEESARIPLLVMHRGTAPAGRVDDTHLVSNGLDLLPTVCDYAGIAAKADPRGRSLRPIIEGKTVDRWRETLGVESQIGRMVVGDRVKYIKYDAGKAQEQLLDLKKDPGETRHFTAEPEYAELLDRLRTAYEKEWFPGR
ncbi:MAG: sulfatase-like hydrolase/transferase [Candidatus Nealsonbacteria bacterium]|nr:sulfatase-like hydrolase/transferase [Candidatus Nealsonbacteria bacterium]